MRPRREDSACPISPRGIYVRRATFGTKLGVGNRLTLAALAASQGEAGGSAPPLSLSLSLSLFVCVFARGVLPPSSPARSAGRQYSLTPRRTT